MLNPTLSNEILSHLHESFKNKGLTKIAGIESRGFLFGYPLAMKLGIPFVLIRKEGKLPYNKISHSYNLEYGSATVEMHTDAINGGDKVLVHDDLLATGGSAYAAAELITKQGGEVVGFSFLVGLSFLNGKEKLNKFTKNIVILADY
jgi:adenine phosphoribosyltransferase